jgi:hypothetical protein
MGFQPPGVPVARQWENKIKMSVTGQITVTVG